MGIKNKRTPDQVKVDLKTGALSLFVGTSMTLACALGIDATWGLEGMAVPVVLSVACLAGVCVGIWVIDVSAFGMLGGCKKP